MMITPHVLVGAAVMKKCDSFLFGGLLAIASHFILDAIPCWDVWFTSIREIIFIVSDVIITLSLLYTILKNCNPNNPKEKYLILSGAFLGIFIDPFSLFINYYKISCLYSITDMHQMIQHTASWTWSAPTQLFISFLSALWIYSDVKRKIRNRIEISS
jgi:hypothetical protein